jgi:DNA-binding Lrp family transcriptional regulator
MDDRDNHLLELLVEDPRRSLTSLAKNMNLSVTAVSKRLRKLENENYIKFEVSINLQKFKIFKMTHAIMFIETKDAKSRAEVIDRFSQCPLVENIFDIVGFEFHLLVCLVSPDSNLLANFMTYCPIRYLDGVKRANCYYSMIDTHRSCFLPITKYKSKNMQTCGTDCSKDCSRYKKLCPGCPTLEYQLQH